jgi:peroxiredoxin
MFRLALMLFAALLCLGAAAKPDPREAKFLESAQLNPDAKVEYFDDSGRRLGFDAFFSLVLRGRSFGYKHDGRVSAKFRLDAPGPAAKAMRAPIVGGRVAGGVGVGDAFPAFALPSTKGGRVTAATLRGRLTLINFFFADCVPCIAEIPALNAYARHYPEVQVLAVTFDDLATAQGFVKQRGLQWPVLADGMPLIGAAGITGFPSFALVGPDGRVRALAHSAAIPPKGAKLDVANLSTWVERNRKKLGSE